MTFACNKGASGLTWQPDLNSLYWPDKNVAVFIWYLDLNSVNTLCGLPTRSWTKICMLWVQMITGTLALDNTSVSWFPRWYLCYPQQTVVMAVNLLGYSMSFVSSCNIFFYYPFQRILRELHCNLIKTYSTECCFWTFK